MKEAFFLFVVSVLCIAFFPHCLDKCTDDGSETKCEVQYVWTLTGKLEPVMNCKTTPSADASVE